MKFAAVKRNFHYKDASGTLMQYKGAVLPSGLAEPHGAGLLTTPAWTFQGQFERGARVSGRLVKINKEEYEGGFMGGLPHGRGV